jgi:hypothetical protein
MANTSGSYAFCDADASFSLTLKCTGPACSQMIGNTNLTCTEIASDSWQCTNGVNCASSYGFSSKFSLVETNTTAIQTQNVSANGTTFIFQQDGMGNGTLENGTTTLVSNGSSTTTSSSGPVASPTSSSTTSAASTSQPYPMILLLTLLALSFCLLQAQAEPIWTGADVNAAVGEIFSVFNAALNGHSLYEVAENAISQQYTQVAIQTCATLVGKGVDAFTGSELAYGQCEEAMIGAEMTALGGSLGLTLRTYAGLGGVLTTALTAADEAAVIAADASIIPEVFIINSALCGLLLAAIEHMILEPASTNLCSVVESAAANHKSTSISTSTTSATSRTSTTSTTTTTPSAPTTTVVSNSPSSPTPNPAQGLSLPSVPPGSCEACQLSVYALGIQGLAAQCNVAIPLGTASDVSVLLCDSSYNGLYSQFCTTLCTNPCATYKIDSWIQSAGSEFNAGDTLATCSSLCPGFQGDGKCPALCTSECGLGADTCVPC